MFAPVGDDDTVFMAFPKDVFARPGNATHPVADVEFDEVLFHGLHFLRGQHFRISELMVVVFRNPGPLSEQYVADKQFGM